jgi:hypothetical protein
MLSRQVHAFEHSIRICLILKKKAFYGDSLSLSQSHVKLGFQGRQHFERKEASLEFIHAVSGRSLGWSENASDAS